MRLALRVAMIGDSAPANMSRRRLSLEERASEQLRTLAKPYRFRVALDAEGFPVIPGRYGQIEWFDGADLAVYTARPRLFARIWAIQGVRRHQTGDTEMRAVFPPEALPHVAAVIHARLRRTQVAPRSLGNLRSRATSGRAEALPRHEASENTRPVDSGPHE